MAEKFGAEWHLVHVVAPMGTYIGTTVTDPLGGMEPAILPNDIELIETQKNTAKESIDTIMQSLQTKPAAVKIFLGDIEDEILDYAQEIKADLIVIGTHQHKGLLRLLSRETSVKILHESQIPILIVPTDLKQHKK